MGAYEGWKPGDRKAWGDAREEYGWHRARYPLE